MLETKGEVARLEADTVAAMQDLQDRAFRNDVSYGPCQRFMLVRGAVVEKLNLQAVTGPGEPGGSRDHPQSEVSLVTDGQLDENMRQGFVRQERHPHAARRADEAQDR